MEWYYAADGTGVGPHSADDIRRFVAEGRIGADTMVWSAAIGEWTVLRAVDAFKDALIPAMAEAMPLERPAEPAPAVAVADASALAHETLAAIEPATPPRAGALSRVAARTIDIMLCAIVVTVCGLLVLANLLPATFYNVLAQPVWALALCGFFVGTILSHVLAVVSRGPGKLAFGLSLIETATGHRPGLQSAARREFGAWIFGLGLGILPLTAVAGLFQLLRVGRGSPASYDAGCYIVEQRPVGLVRRIGAGVLAIGLTAAAAALYIWGSLPAPVSAAVWTNPVSGLDTSIPPGWQWSAETAQDGSALTIFSSAALGQQVLLAAESSPGMSIDDYVAGLAQGLGQGMDLSAWEAAPDGMLARTTTGQVRSPPYPVDIYVYQIADTFWRVIAFDLTTAKAGHFIDPVLFAALVDSYE